jgi:hypothetical protein
MRQEQESMTKLIVAAVVTALGSFFLSSMIFSAPKHHDLKAPVVNTITSTFPDIKNDPAYNTFLNNNSLDATQPVQIGNSQNNQPFSQ